jgi:hypothetical protein
VAQHAAAAVARPLRRRRSRAPERFVDALDLLASAPAPFCTVLLERDQVSLTVRDDVWRRATLREQARDAGGPFRVVTLDQDVGLDVSGFLAPPVQRLAAAKVPIIPHGAYLKEHWVFLERDFDRAVEVIATYIEETSGRRPDVVDGPA